MIAGDKTGAAFRRLDEDPLALKQAWQGMIEGLHLGGDLRFVRDGELVVFRLVRLFDLFVIGIGAHWHNPSRLYFLPHGAVGQREVSIWLGSTLANGAVLSRGSVDSECAGGR